MNENEWIDIAWKIKCGRVVLTTSQTRHDQQYSYDMPIFLKFDQFSLRYLNTWSAYQANRF